MATLIAIYVVSVIFTTIRSRIMVDVSQNIIYDIRCYTVLKHPAGTSVSALRRQTAWKDSDPGGQLCQFGYLMLSNGLINIVAEAFILFVYYYFYVYGRCADGTGCAVWSSRACRLYVLDQK